MSTTAACFENVFGLSRTDCECYSDTAPTDFEVSASGLFLDETPGLNLERIFSAANCGNTGWDKMTKARDAGVKRFTGEVVKYILASSKWKRPNSRSAIGDAKASKAVNLGKPFHGVELKFANHVGGTATIYRVGAAFKFTGPVTVSVYDNDSDDPLTSFVITAENNKRVWTTIDPITVDLGNNTSDNKRLWFIYTPTGGQQALDVKVASCNCGGKPKWEIHNPYYESGVVMDGQQWTAWAMAGGTYGTAIDNRDNWTHSNETQGLMIDVGFACDARTSVCTGTPDYETNPHHSAFAHGARFSAALALVEDVTGSTRVIRENIVDGDQMELLRVSYQKEIDIRAEWLGSELSEEGVNMFSDCFACKDAHGMQIQTIRR